MDKRIDFIFKRRSVREFTDVPVDDETVHLILEAAMAAPSACAKDPWHFIVIRSAEARKTISEMLPNGKFIANAQAGIVVCGDIDNTHASSESYMLQDCSAAIENMLLAISALDLGACWLGVHPREDRIKNISEFFNLPKNIIPIAVIALGHPKSAHAYRTRFSAEKIHFEHWQKNI